MEEGQLIAFLRASHEAMSADFDNSIRIPRYIRNRYSSIPNTEKEWITYLKHKFSYLLLLEKNKTAPTEYASKLKQDHSDYLAEFISGWTSKEEEEKVVYYYRYSQLPENVVHDTWYFQHVTECHQWCLKRQDDLKTWDKTALETDWHGNFLKSYESIGTQFFADYHQDRILTIICKEAIRGLARRIDSAQQYLDEGYKSLGELAKTYEGMYDEVSSCFDCFKETQSKRDEGKTIALPIGENFLTGLSLKLMQVLHSEGFDETAVVTCLLGEIKEFFGCQVCDFLDVTDENDWLVWRAATVNHTDLSPEYQNLSQEQLRQKIRQRESYRRGEGISGSILLLDNDTNRNLWSHVGSNDVLHDPRQSEKHRSAYEKDMYPVLLSPSGKINNFWMFPVFEGRTLIGAFRVVNKLTENGDLQPGGWPYYTRVKLAITAQWFSKFLGSARPQMQSPEDYVAVLERNKKIEEMIDKLKLRWIPRKVVNNFLRHLTRDVSKKQEKRSIGCCILIASTPENTGRWPFNELHPYPLLDTSPGDISEPYDKLDSYHDAVNPSDGAYVFDQNGKFIHIVRLKFTGDDGNTLYGSQVVEWVTKKYDKSFCLLLPRDTKNILAYKDGNRAAEIHLSEGTGDWRFRYPSEIEDLMIEWAKNVEKEIVKMICKACIELSYRGYGAIIVAGEVPDDVFDFGMPKVPYKINENIKEIGIDAFVEFAKLDGATFIESDGVITRVNRTVSPFHDPEGEQLFPGRGARHKAGEKISRIASEALVVIVSENRGISIVADGGKKLSKDL